MDSCVYNKNNNNLAFWQDEYQLLVACFDFQIQEHQLYVEVVEALCEDRIVWRKDGVPLIRSKENPNETCWIITFMVRIRNSLLIILTTLSDYIMFAYFLT